MVTYSWIATDFFNYRGNRSYSKCCLSSYGVKRVICSKPINLCHSLRKIEKGLKSLIDDVIQALDSFRWVCTGLPLSMRCEFFSRTSFVEHRLLSKITMRGDISVDSDFHCTCVECEQTNQAEQRLFVKWFVFCTIVSILLRRYFSTILKNCHNYEVD